MPQKSSWESIIVVGDFSKNWVTGDTIDLAQSLVKATDKHGDDVSDGMISDKASSGSQLQARVSGGGPGGSPYNIHFLCMTTQGNKWEVDMTVTVKDIGPIMWDSSSSSSSRSSSSSSSSHSG